MLKLRLLKFIILILCIPSACISGFGAYASYKKVSDMSAWLESRAVVKSVNIDSKHRSKGTAYCPLVIVSYSYNAIQFSSNLDINEYPCSPKELNIKKLLESLKIGENIDVFINPSNPEEVRLYSYSLGGIFYLLVGCTVAILIAFFIFLLTPANKLRQRTASPHAA